MNGTAANHRYHPYQREQRPTDRNPTGEQRYRCIPPRRDNLSKPTACSAQVARPPSTVRVSGIPLAKLLTMTPTERQTWLRTLKRTNGNENAEQKTQYLEALLRKAVQQKSTENSATFDRTRFASRQAAVPSANSTPQVISQIESSTSVTPRHSTAERKVEPSPFSAFLIDNCDDEVLPPASPPPRSSLPCHPIFDDAIQTIPVELDTSVSTLVDEFDAGALAEQRKKFKRQMRLQSKEQGCGKSSPPSETVPVDESHGNDIRETSSDSIIECAVIATAQTATVATMTDGGEVEDLSGLFQRLRQQEEQLRQLRESIQSLLHEKSAQNGSVNEDRLQSVLNQALLSGCWLCSGKSYTETAIQCNTLD